jgi:hypothetical protein
MVAFMVLALGACVVSIMAGLSGVWAAPISLPEPEAKRSRKPVKPRLPPEVIAVLSRNSAISGSVDLNQEPGHQRSTTSGSWIPMSIFPANPPLGGTRSTIYSEPEPAALHAPPKQTRCQPPHAAARRHTLPHQFRQACSRSRNSAPLRHPSRASPRGCIAGWWRRSLTRAPEQVWIRLACDDQL